MLIKVFKVVLLLSIECGMLSIAFLLLRTLLWKRIHPQLQYLLWGILILRMLLPIAPQIPINVFTLFPKNITFTQSANQLAGTPSSKASSVSSNIHAKSTPENSTPLKKNSSLPDSSVTFPNNLTLLWNAAAVVWLSGCIVFLLYTLVVNLRLSRKLRRIGRSRNARLNSELDNCRQILKIRRPVSIICDPAFRSPAAFGLIYPCIILSPVLADELTDEDIRYIFLHELSHIRRHDNEINLLTVVIRSIHWFNPVLWLALAKMKCDCEISCDAAVLKILSKSERRAYGRTIVSVIESLASPVIHPAAIGFADGFSKRRISIIVSHKNASAICSAAAVTLAVLTGFCSLPAKEPAKIPVANSSAGTSQVSSVSGGALTAKSKSRSASVSSGSKSDSDKVLSLKPKNYKSLDDFAAKNGYQIEMDSGRTGTLKLPKSFLTVSQNEKVGSYFKECNETSKKYGLDFSSYLGKTATLIDYDTEKSDGTCAYLFGLYADHKLIGIWISPHDPASNDLRSTMHFGGLYTNG
ncbi:MAG TPA: M56 family metallopeptidase [Clostridia bacterium]|nr:M56 family metallopeptidase [Clostridia bacterium]